MNIWIVNHYAIPPSLGGLVRHYYFSKYLQDKGHQVRIFTSSKIHNTDINYIKDKKLYREETVDEIEYTFVKSRDYKGNGLDRILNMAEFPFQVIRAMKKFVKRERPDVIYTSSPDIFVAFFAVYFAKKHHIPVVVEVRDLWPASIIAYNKISARNPLAFILYMIEKNIYKKADKIVFTMPGGKEYIEDKHWTKSVRLDKIEYINNGVDIEEFEQNITNWKIQDYDLEDDSIFKIIYVGSVRYVNNLQTLVDAAKILKNQGIKNVKFLIYGDGTEKDILEEECKKMSLDVCFKGHVDKKYIPYILSKSNLNLINVKKAGINKYGCSWNKFFEYMASKKPILCNLHVKYDLIEKYQVGISKTFRSAEEYAEAILKFVYMPQTEYQNYCTNAEQYSKKYDYKILCDRVEVVCESVCKGGE